MKPYTLSNGTYLPPGTFVSASSRAIHFDPENYDYPEEFDGFRFARMQEEVENNGEEARFKYQLVTTGTEYLPFGHGKHAWYAPILYIYTGS
jgi:cytochrome P450